MGKKTKKRKIFQNMIEMKLKLFFKNEIIIEIIVKPEWKWNYVLLPRALSKLINNYPGIQDI